MKTMVMMFTDSDKSSWVGYAGPLLPELLDIEECQRYDISVSVWQNGECLDSWYTGTWIPFPFDKVRKYLSENQ